MEPEVFKSNWNEKLEEITLSRRVEKFDKISESINECAFYWKSDLSSSSIHSLQRASKGERLAFRRLKNQTAE